MPTILPTWSLMPKQTADLDRLHHLISRHADELITPDEHAALTALLAADPEARRTWFLRNDIDLALASGSTERQEALLSPGVVAMPGGAVPGPSKRARVASLAGAALAATGMLVGIGGASAVWALAVPWSGVAEMRIPVLAESFEDGPAATIAGLPRGLEDPDGDVWRGDDACVVKARQEVQPIAGSQMLRFERSTFAGEDVPKSAWSDVYRFVDARPSMVLAENRPVSARLAASFALSADACRDGEAYSACVQLYAFDRDISDAPKPLPLTWVRENCVASGMKKVPLPCGRGGWQRVSVDASLPPEARFVLVHVASVRDEPKPTSDPAVFRGHFIDDVSLELYVRKAD